MRSLLFVSLVLSVLCVPLPFAHAAEAAPDDAAKLRDALRNTILQVRNAEADKAALQATQAQLTDDKKALAKQIDLLKKHAVADKATADKTVSTLNEKATAQSAEIASLQADVAKWKAAAEQSTTLATTKEIDRAKLAAEIIVLQRKVDDREAKNLALYKTGNEILTRYEKFGLGEALTAREPFVGATRTKLETLVQDYADKLADNQVKP